jgi:hypothetical protein
METLNALGVILNIGGTLGLSVLGMFAVAWVNANTTPTTGAFSLSIFWRDNAQAFLWALIGMIIIITILVLVPSATDFFKFIGFSIEIPISGAGALTLGGFVYDTARKRFKTQK